MLGRVWMRRKMHIEFPQIIREDYLEDSVTGERIILKEFLTMLCEGLEWISLSQDRDWLRYVVNRGINIQV